MERIKNVTIHNNDKMIMDRLEYTLKRHKVPEEYYSIGEYSEESICIEQQGKKWIVYSGERGNKYNLKSYPGIGKACQDVIQRVAISNLQMNKMYKDFQRFIRKTPSVAQGTPLVYRLEDIPNGLVKIESVREASVAYGKECQIVKVSLEDQQRAAVEKIKRNVVQSQKKNNENKVKKVHSME